MAATTRRSVSRLALAVLLVLLAGACGGKKATSTATAEPATTTTVAATTTTVPPLTAEERAWLDAVTKLRKATEKAFSASTVYLTRAKMTSFAEALRTCSRELARIGAPSDRLQPVYALVQKACKAHDKGAKCFATAASVSMADGGVVAGTPQEKTQRQALDCGGEAQGNGANLLISAESTGDEIKADIG